MAYRASKVSGNLMSRRRFINSVSGLIGLVALLVLSGCNSTELLLDDDYNPRVTWGRHVVSEGKPSTALPCDMAGTTGISRPPTGLGRLTRFIPVMLSAWTERWSREAVRVQWPAGLHRVPAIRARKALPQRPLKAPHRVAGNHPPGHLPKTKLVTKRYRAAILPIMTLFGAGLILARLLRNIHLKAPI